MRIKLLFISIIIMAAALRLFHLDSIPNGLYSDEAAFGYNAFSILKTGKDEFGESYPLAFKSFGDYKAPLYFYYLVPFVNFFDLNVWSIRVGSALLGILLTIVSFFLGRYLSLSNKGGLLTSFFVALMPLALQFSRMAHENNLVILLISVGIYMFFLGLNRSFLLVLSFVPLAGSLYAYHDARVFTPLCIILLIVLYRRILWKKKISLIAGLVLFLLIVFPLLRMLNSAEILTRAKYVTIFTDAGIPYEINKERGEASLNHYFIPSLFHNKYIYYTRIFLDNYLKHYSADFLIFNGDPVQIYRTIGNGILLAILVPFSVIGAYFLFRRKRNHRWFILGWMAISAIPASLTRYVPSASRFITILPAFSLVIAVGIIFYLNKTRNYKLKGIFHAVVSLFFVLNLTYYLYMYYINTPIRYAHEWHYGMKEVVAKVVQLEDRYPSVWFGKNAWGYIYPLFYLKYPPEKYQPQAELSQLNEFGFGWVEGFDKYNFGEFPLDLIERKNTLFIGNSHDFFKTPIKPLYSIYYPNGDLAFYIADNSSF